ncbi:hypothetical protein [uncultured Draconibacterium sp.]|uniref:hypothetical protein n=1 Tax=uncultured Draconibacterium sp. TaxID=1573823 RepID=UPI0025E4AA08|nr:hypothetical protein [uncultured Draconibacterium sp.]
MPTINLFEALREMRSSQKPFTVTVVKYSVSRKTGGQVETLIDVLEAGQVKAAGTENLIAFRAEGSDIVRRYNIYGIRRYNGMTVTMKRNS